MTDKEKLFRNTDTTSGVGNMVRSLAKDDRYPIPDLSYVDETPDYDDVESNKRNRNSIIDKGLGLIDDINEYAQNSDIGKYVTGAMAVTGAVMSPDKGVSAALGHLADAYSKLDDKPENYSAGTFVKDAFASLLNMRDQTNISSESGILAQDVLPKKESAQFEVDYLTLMNTADSALQKYRSEPTPENREEYLGLLDDVRVLTPRYKQYVADRFNNEEQLKTLGLAPDMMAGVADAKARRHMLMPIKDRLADANERFEKESEREVEHNQNISDYKKDMWDREHGNNWLFSHKVSEFYANKEQDTPIEFTNPESWMFRMPGIIGSSTATLGYQATGMVTAFVANMARQSVLRAASKATLNPYVAVGGELAAMGLAIGGVGVSTWATMKGRYFESMAEIYDNYKLGITERATESGIDLESAIANGREYLAKNDTPQTAEQLTDEEVLDLMLTSNIPSGDKAFDAYKNQSRKGLDNLFYQNMMLGAIDLGVQVIAFPFMGKLASTAAKATGVPQLSEKVVKAAGKYIDKAIDFGHKVAPKLVRATPNTKAFGKHIVGGAARIGSVMGLEGMEESIQYIQGQRYIENKYNGEPGLLNALWNNTSAAYEGIKAITGIGDSVHSNDAELMENFKAGAMLGLLLGGGPRAYVDGKGYSDQLKANKVVRQFTADQLKDKEDFAKAQMYANEASLKRTDKIIQSLEWVKDNLPEGVTEQDIDAEIKRAKEVMSFANSSFVKAISNDLKIETGSDKFHNLVAANNYLNNKHQDEIANNTALRSEYAQTYNTEALDDYVDRFIPNRTDVGQREVFKKILKLNTEKVALENLMDGLAQVKEDAAEVSSLYGTKFNKDNIDRYLKEIEGKYINIKTAEQDLNTMMKDAGSSFTVNDIDPFVSPYGEFMSPDIAFQKLILSDISTYEALRRAYAFNGNHIDRSNSGYDVNLNTFVHSLRSTPYEALSKSQKKSLQNTVNTWLNEYERVEAETQEMENHFAETVDDEASDPIIDPVIPEIVQEPEVVEKPAQEESSANDLLSRAQSEQTPEKETKNEKTLPTQAEKEALIKIAEATGDEILKLGVADGTFAGDGILNLDADGNVILTRFAENEEMLIKSGNVTDPETLKNIAGTFNGEQIATSGVKGGLEAFSKDGAIVGEYKIPLSDFLIILKKGYIIFEGLGNKEFVLSPHIARQYLSTINGIAVNKTNEFTKQPVATEPEDTSIADFPETDVTALLGRAASEETTPSGRPVINEGLTESDVYGKELQPQTQEEPVEEPNEVFDTTAPIDIEITAESSKEALNEALQAGEDVGVENMGQDSSKGLVRSTFFYSYESTTPMSAGYKTGNDLSTYLTTPGFQEHTTYHFDVVDYQEEPSVRLVITDTRNGDKYLAALKTPTGANALYLHLGSRMGIEMNQTDISELTKFRNEIIALHKEASARGAKVVPTVVSFTNGLFNTNVDNAGYVVQRPIAEISGFGIPSDQYAIDRDTVKLGIAKGFKGDYVIVDRGGNLLPGHGGSGSVFIYPNFTPSGKPVNIQLNPRRFSFDTPAIQARVADMIFDLLVRKGGNKVDRHTVQYKGQTVDVGLTAYDMLRLFLRNGPQTMVNDEQREEFSFLVPKQLYFNGQTQKINVGDTVYDRDRLLSDPAYAEEFKGHIMNEFHWSIDKEWLWDKIGDTFGDIQGYFYKTGEEKLSIIPGLIEFDLTDVGLKKEGNRVVEDEDHFGGLSWISWYAKRGILLSDLKDNLFKAPFVYAEGLKIVEVEPAEQKQTNVDNKLSDQATSTIIDTQIEQTGESNAMDLLSRATSQEDAQTGMSIDNDEYNEFFGIDRSFTYKLTGKTINTNESVNWLKSKLGLTDDQIGITDTIIHMGRSGVKAMGLTTADSILLYSGAEVGTEYHEAFHRVNLLLHTEQERQSVYTAYLKQNKLTKEQINEKQIEENLAEGFREWKLSGSKRFGFKVIKLFKKIFGFIDAVKNMSTNDIYELYSRIENGEFKDIKVNQESLTKFKEVYEDGGAPFTVGTLDKPVEFKYIPTLYNYYRIINSLKSLLFMVNGVRAMDDVTNMNLGKLHNFLNNSLQSNKLSEDQKNVIREVIENFDEVFVPELRMALSDIGVKEISRTENDHISAIEGGDVSGNEILRYDKASYEISKKKNALASAKLFMATIAETRFVFEKDKEGNIIKRNKPVIDQLTGFPVLVDFDTAWNTLLNNLYDIENISELKKRVSELSEHSPFFYSLNKKLDKPMDSNLETQLLQTIKSHKHKMYYIAYSGERSEDGKTVQVSFRVGDSDTLRAIRMYPLAWSNQFFTSSGIVSTAEGKQSINKPILEKTIKRYNKLITNISSYINKADYTDASKPIEFKRELVQILSDLGIGIDVDTLDTLMLNMRNRELVGNNEVERLHSLLTNQRARSLFNLVNKTLTDLLNDKPLQYRSKTGKMIAKPLDQVFSYEPFVSALAEAYAMVHPRPEEMGILGAEGNLLYPIAQNNYLSDAVRWLNSNKTDGTKTNDLVDKLSAVTYNKNSMILRNLRSGKKIDLRTFVNFSEDSAGDRGRDYLSISPIEDYLSKMTLTYNDHIIFPTMADKKTYFSITGVKLFHSPITIARDENGGASLQLDSKILNQFLAYAEDEWNAIKKFYSKDSKKILDENPERKVKNYHSSNLGGRFRYFTGLWLNVNGTAEFTDLNGLLDSFEKEGRIVEALALIDDQYFNKDGIYKQAAINELLKRTILDEINTATELGIIAKAKEESQGRLPKLSNILLDGVRYNNKVAEYTASSDPLLSSNSTTFAAFDMIADFTVNNLISIIETEKVFTKDPAFYKNTDDKIKRLPEVLSTGDNLRTEWPSGHRLAGVTHYTVAELKDNEISSTWSNELRELFYNSYLRKVAKEINGVSESKLDDYLASPENIKNYSELTEAARLATDRDMVGYTNGSINQADAAVYISPEMYKNIVEMLGEWHNVEEAFDMMESGTEWLSDPEKYEIAMKTLIKPLKMTSFGDNFDTELGLDIPIFDKMALFPMFRVLATGDNNELYQRMTATGKYANATPIYMVKFGSAVKVGSRTSTSFYEDKANTKIADLNKMQVYSQEYKHLRRQLITDPHHSERQMLGTQVAKAALSNVILDRTYAANKPGLKPVTGHQIRQEVFGAMNALSNIGASEFIKQIGTVDNGELVVSSEKLSELLIKDATQSGLPYDVIEGLTIKDGEFRIPLSALSDSKWIESRFISMLNQNVIDINLPGGAFIQMSSFGFKSISGVSDSKLNKGRTLGYRNPDGSMDAMVSINLFNHLIPDKNKKTFQEAKQWLIDNNIIGDNAEPSAMGYRIPTQGLSSIAAIKIVDVLPSVVGDTIVLPDEFTKLTGSDFDIDKLYIARYNYKNGKKVLFEEDPKSEEMWSRKEEKLKKQGFDDEQISREFLKWIGKNKGKNKWELNSREANENRLLDMYMSVLTDDNNVDETRLPLDNTTDYLKNVVLKNVDGGRVKTTAAPYYYLSPTFQLNKKYEYTGGKNGIAPFALNNVHHALTQLMNLSFKNHPVIAYYGIQSLSGINSKDESGIRILDWLSAMINAHVDVAKDPYVIRFNIVQWTYNMTNMLLRTGVGENTFYFLPQAILKEMASKVASSQGRYGIDTTKSISRLEQDAVDEVYNKYLAIAKKLAYGNTEFTNRLATLDVINEQGLMEVPTSHVLWDKEWLLQQLKEGRQENKSFNYFYNQLLIYKVYSQLDPFAKGMSELVHTSQIDTKKSGNNFMLQKSFLYRVRRTILDNNVFTAGAMKSFFKDTFMHTKIKNSIQLGASIFKNYMLRTNDVFVKNHDKILRQLGQSATKNDRLINAISNGLESQIKARFYSNKFKQSGFDAWNFFYGDNTMARRLTELKSDIIGGKYPDMLSDDGKIKNEFLNYIDARPGSATYDLYYSPDFITTNAMNVDDVHMQDKLKRYWQELLSSPHVEVRKFAEDLVDFAFITSGDNYTMNGIFNLVPVDYRIKSGYADHIRGELQDMTNGVNNANLKDFYKNNWHNGLIVPDIKMERWYRGIDGKMKQSVLPAIMSNTVIPGTDLRFPLVIFNNRVMPTGINEFEQPLFPRYMKYNMDMSKNPTTTVLYEYFGNHVNDGEVIPVYKAVHKKGINSNGLVITEYDGYTNSSLAFNNLPIEEQPWQFTESYVDGILDLSNETVHTRKNARTMLLEIEELRSFEEYDLASAFDYDYIMNADVVESEEIPVLEDIKDDTKNVTSKSNSYANVLNDSDGNPLTVYRGYAMTEDREAKNILETLPKEGESNSFNYVTSGIHFSTDKDAAKSYADLKSDKTPTGNGKINSAYRGDYGKVSSYIVKGNEIYRFDDIKSATKAIESGEINDWDVIYINKDSTPFSTGSEVIVRNSDQVVPIANTESIAETWSSKEGWSEEYFEKNVLPRLHEAWQIEFEATDNNAPENLKWKTAYEFGKNKRTGIKSGTTIEAILRGEKTATTRYESDTHFDYWKNAKVGDVIKFSGYGMMVKVVVTKPLTKLQEQSSDKAIPTVNVERFDGIIKRGDVKANPRTLYLFGDNDIRRGLGGQAKEMRGEPNTVGISTKKLPSNSKDAFKTDDEYDENIKIIDKDIQNVIDKFSTGDYDKVVIPKIGVGLAKLPTYAPNTFAYLQNKLNELSTLLGKRSEPLSDQTDISEISEITNHSVDAYVGDTYFNSKSAGNLSILSNFSETPVTIDGIVYATAENAFQAAKTNDTKVKQALSELSPNLAKFTGKRIPLRPDWEMIKDDEMYNILLAKFTQNENAKQILLSTAPSTLIHDTSNRALFRNNDTYWGNGWDKNGQNKMGKILQEVRNTIISMSPQEIKSTNNQVDNLGTNEILVLGKKVDMKTFGLSFKLNDGQVAALNNIVDWSNNTEELAMTLEGYAGTGKSTIMKVVAELLGKDYNAIIPVAPTHQAKGVLSKYMGIDAITAHSMLGLGPDVDLDKFNLSDLEFKKVSFGVKGTGILFIIDEASMINDALTQAIIEKAIQSRSRILFVGDSDQIQPVNQDHISNVFTNFRKSTLEVIERQKSGNPLLDNLITARRNIHTPQSGIPRYDASFNEFAKGLVVANTITGNDGKDFVKLLNDTFGSQEFIDNPLLIRWLAYRNDLVKAANTAIRKLLGRTSVIVKGELLKMYGKGAGFQNSDELIVQEVREDVDVDLNEIFKIDSDNKLIVPLTIAKVKHVSDVDNSDIMPSQVYMFTNSDYIQQYKKALIIYNVKIEKQQDLLYEQLINGMITESTYYGRTIDLNKERLEMNSSILSMYKLEAPIEKARYKTKRYNNGTRLVKNVVLTNKTIDYGYASTTHKAQGSTYKYVIISFEDIMNNSNYEEKMRLLYTAMSRPTDAVILQANQQVSEEATLKKFNETRESLNNDYNSDIINKCRKK